MLPDTSNRQKQHQEFEKLIQAQYAEIKKNNGILTPEMAARFRSQEHDMQTRHQLESGDLGPPNYESIIKYGQAELEKQVEEFRDKMENNHLDKEQQERRERLFELNKTDMPPQKDKGFEF